MVKAASGAFIQAVHDESARTQPQWRRVYLAVRRAVARGALAAGERLPSARQLAEDWRVSRGAVDDAFAQLQLEGLIERRVGDGTYVRSPIAAAASSPARAPREPSALAHAVLAHMAEQAGTGARWEFAFRCARTPLLHPRAVDLDGFPLDTWRRLLAAAAAESRRALLLEAPPRGLPALRAAISRHLLLQRGFDCRAEQVIVVSGPNEGLNLLIRLLVPPGGSVWLEDPTHPSLPWLVESLGARAVGVPLDEQGFDVGQARRLDPHASLVYLHPLSQYPLNRRTTVARGDELLEWACAGGGHVVEGHFNDELWPRSMQPPALASRAPGRVFMLGTFESVMFPSLRVGYVVVPPAFVDRFGDAITLWGARAGTLTQWALAEFIERGHLDERLRRLRERLAQRREHLRTGLLAALPAAVQPEALTPTPTLALKLPPGVSDVDVARRLRGCGVLVEPLSAMAWPRARAPRAERCNGIVLGYGDGDGAAFEEALAHLLRELGAALDGCDRSGGARGGGGAGETCPGGCAPYQPTGENA